VPTNHGVGLDDDQSLFPPRPELRQQDPEGPIYRSNPGLRSFLGARSELLTQGEFNEYLLIPGSKEGEATSKEDRRKPE
jgi:hypothetical protein